MRVRSTVKTALKRSFGGRALFHYDGLRAPDPYKTDAQRRLGASHRAKTMCPSFGGEVGSTPMPSRHSSQAAAEELRVAIDAAVTKLLSEEVHHERVVDDLRQHRVDCHHGE